MILAEHCKENSKSIQLSIIRRQLELVRALSYLNQNNYQTFLDIQPEWKTKIDDLKDTYEYLSKYSHPMESMFFDKELIDIKNRTNEDIAKELYYHFGKSDLNQYLSDYSDAIKRNSIITEITNLISKDKGILVDLLNRTYNKLEEISLYN